MTHYFCTGECEIVSQKPGICEAEGCSMKGQPLTPCECTDGEHKGLSEIEEIEEEQEEEE
jgi:hypothetical protein